MDHFLAGAYRGSASREHLDSYLDEFVFRFNRRSSHHRGLVFLRLLQRAVSAPPTRYQDLTAAARPGNPTAAGRTGPRSRPGTLEGTITNYPWHQHH
ncbi:hypothetical protein SAMN05216355_1117 [Actinomyces ruminicola]|uniref:ISXO2-like transposase domain-containing protein n=2 Tax=Actinomyces ruminicola TaxID=332524 RepID=A0A1H0DKV8_9ACTO|nr:hypothetical protein SAMN05216355_1117 [Actinomyces ruminicola]